MDIYTTAHKNVPFVNNKTYPALCFTCYFVPKIKDQKYKKDGSLDEETDLPYSCKNINSPKELFESGAADTLRQAKICVSAVEQACKGASSPKNPRRPEASWNIC